MFFVDHRLEQGVAFYHEHLCFDVDHVERIIIVTIDAAGPAKRRHILSDLDQRGRLERVLRAIHVDGEKGSYDDGYSSDQPFPFSNRPPELAQMYLLIIGSSIPVTISIGIRIVRPRA